jgi:transcriptional regulator
LCGHISKEKSTMERSENEVLAVFSCDPHSYISSSWYDHEKCANLEFILQFKYMGKSLDHEAVVESLKN